MSISTQSFLLLNPHSGSWQGFGPCHLAFVTAIPRYRLGVSTGLGPLLVGSVEVATLFWRIKESNHMCKGHFIQLASVPEKGTMHVHSHSIGMSLARCLFWRNFI